MSAPVRTVAQNALILTTLKLVSPALSMLVIVALSRTLGSDGLGRYTLALTYLNFITTVTPFGLNALLMREGARDLARLPALFANSVTLTFGLSLASLPALVAISHLLGYDVTTRYTLYAIGLAVVPATLLVLFDGIFVSRQRTAFIGYYTAAEVAVRVGGAALSLFMGYGIMAVVAAQVAGQWAALLVAATLAAKLGAPLRPAVDRAVMRQLLRTGPTFLSISVFSALFWRIDVILLSSFGTLQQVGIYGAAYRIVDMIRLLPQTVCLSVYPLVSQAAADVSRLATIGRSTIRLLWMMSLPVVVGGMLVAEPLLVATVGEDFRGGGPVLSVLLWTVLPYTLIRYHAYVIQAVNRERVDLMLNVVMSAVAVLANVLLVPTYGALGAAAACLLAVSIFAAAQVAFLWRHFPGHSGEWPSLPRLVAATLLMAAAVWLRRGDGLVLSIAIGAAVYTAALFATGFTSKSEILQLARLVGARRAGGITAAAQ